MNNTPTDPLIAGLEGSSELNSLIDILIGDGGTGPIMLPHHFITDPSTLHDEGGSSEEFINNLDELIVDNEFMKKELQCSICFEDFKEGDKCTMLPCPTNHVFHSSDDCSVIPWLRRKNNCPLCRQDFPKDEDIDGSPNEEGPMVPYNEGIINQMNIIGEFLHELHVLESGDTELQTVIELSLNDI